MVPVAMRTFSVYCISDADIAGMLMVVVAVVAYR
jgi:hypothetical protein